MQQWAVPSPAIAGQGASKSRHSIPYPPFVKVFLPRSFPYLVRSFEMAHQSSTRDILAGLSSALMVK